MFDDEYKRVLTFGEFIELVNKNPMKLILPTGYKTIKNDCIGVIESKCFRPLHFTQDSAKAVIKMFKVKEEEI